MAIESACIPLPSEIIMPFSGYLVSTGQMNLWIVSFFGAFGNLIGSITAYLVGYYGGRPIVEKYGKFIFLSHEDLDSSDRWFNKHGESTVFFTRMLPIIRTFISLPAGISRMNFIKFSAYTFIGSLPWCLFLAFLGLKLGENWSSLESYFRKADILIGAVLIIGLIYWVRRHFKTIK